ncbi:hypothetical protein GCM10020220_032860 [Nonomuraea rubra]
MQGRRWIGGQIVSPQDLDQAVGRHRPALAEEQRDEQHPDLRLTYLCQGTVSRSQLQRAQDPETHNATLMQELQPSASESLQAPTVTSVSKVAAVLLTSTLVA